MPRDYLLNSFHAKYLVVLNLLELLVCQETLPLSLPHLQIFGPPQSTKTSFAKCVVNRDPFGLLLTSIRLLISIKKA